MTSIIQVVNLSLLECSNRNQIQSLSDNSTAANAAALFYTPKTQMLLRGANWGFARKQVLLTQWKAAVVNGAVSSDPPPQPWQFSYLRPADCLRARFIQQYYTPATSGTPLTTSPNGFIPQPTVDTSIPFVDAMDVDGNGNPIQVILTNMPNAQLVYTADLSQYPDMWDALFLTAETAMLASYFINALQRDPTAMQMQIAIARAALDQARAVNASEGMTKVDHLPDWMAARAQGGIYNGPVFQGGAGSTYGGGWDSVSFPGGLSY